MFSGQDVNGKPSHGSMVPVVQFIVIFKNGEKQVFFEKIWALGLEKYDELEGIGWEWQSVDGCMVKAPLAREAVGRNPTDRGKNGHKKEYIDG